MKLHPHCHVLFLLAAMQVLSAFKIPCWAFCNEQTKLQNDYVSARDGCREYASLTVDTNTESLPTADGGERNKKLLEYFADCMNEKGWTVPGGKNPDEKPPLPAPAPMPPIVTQSEADAIAVKRKAPAILSRSVECSYARHAALYTSESKALAQACDLECTQGRKLGKKVAACAE